MRFRLPLAAAAAPLAALLLPAAPAGALDPPFPAWGSGASVSVHVGGHHPGFGHHRRGRGFGAGGAIIVEDRDYRGDTAWRHDSFNDWWHERPLRNRPAWVVTNHGCARQYWMGGEWRC